MNYRFLLPVILTAVLLGSCENAFSPKAPYEERIVVFSVLDATAPYQVVRLESTFDAELISPDEPIGQKEITEAEVSIKSDRKTYVFHDTLITQADGGQKTVWINRELVPSEGVTYTMSVKVPKGTTPATFDEITATTTVPSRSYLQLETTTSGLRVSAIENAAYPGSAWYFRIWVVGTKNVDGQEVEVRREVPVNFDTDTQTWVFTEPSRHTVELYPMGNVVRTQSELRQIDEVFGRDVVATAYSLDVFIYSYYKLVRGFDDPVSVRQDRPDVSNIRNGVGIFGAIVADSVRRNYNTLVSQ